MDIPAELRDTPPAGTLAWVADQVGAAAEVMTVERLTGAYASAVHAIAAHGRQHVLRRWFRGNGPGVIGNEAAVLAALEPFDVPAPRLVAADPFAAQADVPALLMTRLPGAPDLAPRDLDGYLDELVRVLRAIHAAPLDLDALPAYEPWDYDGPVPAAEPVLLHRDFHPGNVLWDDGRVRGVVDWTYACHGPAAADVAHCRLNLHLLFGGTVGDEFAARYGPLDDLAFFDLVDVKSMLTEGLAAWRWEDAGRADLTDEVLTARASEFRASALSRRA